MDKDIEKLLIKVHNDIYNKGFRDGIKWAEENLMIKRNPKKEKEIILGIKKGELTK